jgi:hypothetical protein
MRSIATTDGATDTDTSDAQSAGDELQAAVPEAAETPRGPDG